MIPVHTIAQWMALDKETQSSILLNIKLKERLQAFLFSLNERKTATYEAPTWVPCNKCEKKGWVEMKPRYPGIHPSQLPHPCLLRIYKEMVGEESHEKIDPRLRLIFDLGHAVHGIFQGYGMKGAWGEKYRPEVEISERYQKLAEELMLEGHADAENFILVQPSPLGPTYEVGLVHEYKSINTDAFKKLTKPKSEHKTQAMLYSAALDRPIVVYMYFSKNDSALQDFPVPFDPGAWEEVRGKAVLLKDHFDRGVPPPGKVDYHCRDCGFAFNCAAFKNKNKR